MTIYYESELYHHGVKGMKWGVRRARKQMAKLTGRKESSITEAEAKQFKTDVRKGVRTGEIPFGKDYATTFYRNSDNTRIGKRYYRAVMKQRDRRATVISLTGTAAMTAGVMYLTKKGLI